jgi:hypothetical protein
MTEDTFNRLYESYELEAEYANYILAHVNPEERLICNGDSLTDAMDDGYLFEDFKATMVTGG